MNKTGKRTIIDWLKVFNEIDYLYEYLDNPEQTLFESPEIVDEIVKEASENP